MQTRQGSRDCEYAPSSPCYNRRYSVRPLPMGKLQQCLRMMHDSSRQRSQVQHQVLTSDTKVPTAWFDKQPVHSMKLISREA